VTAVLLPAISRPSALIERRYSGLAEGLCLLLVGLLISGRGLEAASILKTFCGEAG
jgi:hypothetical protein